MSGYQFQKHNLGFRVVTGGIFKFSSIINYLKVLKSLNNFKKDDPKVFTFGSRLKLCTYIGISMLKFTECVEPVLYKILDGVSILELDILKPSTNLGII